MPLRRNLWAFRQLIVNSSQLTEVDVIWEEFFSVEEMCNSSDSSIVSLVAIEACLNRCESAFQSSHLCFQRVNITLFNTSCTWHLTTVSSIGTFLNVLRESPYVHFFHKVTKLEVKSVLWLRNIEMTSYSHTQSTDSLLIMLNAGE